MASLFQKLNVVQYCMFIFQCIYRSYSWSTNVCGQKEWLLYPPGEEEHLRDTQGNLPLDLTSLDTLDTNRYPNAHRAKGPLTVIQHPGETIFVPRYVYSIHSDILGNFHWSHENHLHPEIFCTWTTRDSMIFYHTNMLCMYGIYLRLVEIFQEYYSSFFHFFVIHAWPFFLFLVDGSIKFAI